MADNQTQGMSDQCFMSSPQSHLQTPPQERPRRSTSFTGNYLYSDQEPDSSISDPDWDPQAPVEQPWGRLHYIRPRSRSESAGSGVALPGQNFYSPIAEDDTYDSYRREWSPNYEEFPEDDDVYFERELSPIGDLEDVVDQRIRESWESRVEDRRELQAKGPAERLGFEFCNSCDCWQHKKKIRRAQCGHNNCDKHIDNCLACQKRTEQLHARANQSNSDSNFN